MKKWLVLAIAVLLAIAGVTKTQSDRVTQKPAESTGNVAVRVVDGDTFELDNKQKVRLIGIDAPEVSGDKECFGDQATERLRQLIEGKEVRMEKDVSETDRYGRLLRYVYVGDVFVNQVLVADGYANASSYPPDVAHQDEFRQAERLARETGSGLWGICPSTTLRIPTSVLGAESFVCDCYKGCKDMVSCQEAQYQLSTCGCRARDGDGDGVACNGGPLRC